MQAHDSNRECSEASALDGRRDDAGRAVPASADVVRQEVSDVGNGQVRVVNLSATITGKGGLAAA